MFLCLSCFVIIFVLLFSPVCQNSSADTKQQMSCQCVIDWPRESRHQSTLITVLSYRCVRPSVTCVTYVARLDFIHLAGRCSSRWHETALSTKWRGLTSASKLLVFMYSLIRLLSLVAQSEFDFDWWTMALELTHRLIHICHHVCAYVLCIEFKQNKSRFSIREANVSL